MPASKPRLAAIVAPTLEGMGYELVRVAVLGRDRPTVQIMADRADGSQITVEDCEAISHALGAVLDVEDPIPGAWIAGGQLGRHRPPADPRRRTGTASPATWRGPRLIAPIDGRKRFSGIVLGADDNAARLRLDDGTEVALPLRRHPPRQAGADRRADRRHRQPHHRTN